MNDFKELIQIFYEYRNMLEPMQKNLSDFAEGFGGMKSSLEELNAVFGHDVKSDLANISADLKRQAGTSTDLIKNIEKFMENATQYTAQVSKMYEVFEGIGSRLEKVNELEFMAERQLEKLDEILQQKATGYDIEGLKSTLNKYNDNVNEVSNFFDTDAKGKIQENTSKLNAVVENNEKLLSGIAENNLSLEKIIVKYDTTSELLKKVVEKNYVNEEYIFEILDKWAMDRKVKTKK